MSYFVMELTFEDFRSKRVVPGRIVAVLSSRQANSAGKHYVTVLVEER